MAIQMHTSPYTGGAGGNRGNGGCGGAGRGHDSPMSSALRLMRAERGKARQAGRVFHTSVIPMVLVDNERRYVEANRAARLVFRMSAAELRRQRIEDLTPPADFQELAERWRRLISTGCVAGDYTVRFHDGSELSVTYCAVANLLPGRHLIVFAPASWPEDELGPHALELGGSGNGDAAVSGPLTPREREVLSLVASGADLQQIADELTISLATVRTHIGNAHRKLGSRNRPHAVALAMKQGLIEPRPWGGKPSSF